VISESNVFPLRTARRKRTDSFKYSIPRFICPVCYALVSENDFIFSDRFVEGLEPDCHEVINLCPKCIG
jgi:hypothetical protein